MDIINFENTRRNSKDCIMVNGEESFREKMGLFWMAWADYMANKGMDYELWMVCYIRANIYLKK